MASTVHRTSRAAYEALRRDTVHRMVHTHGLGLKDAPIM